MSCLSALGWSVLTLFTWDLGGGFPGPLSPSMLLQMGPRQSWQQWGGGRDPPKPGKGQPVFPGQSLVHLTSRV